MVHAAFSSSHVHTNNSKDSVVSTSATLDKKEFWNVFSVPSCLVLTQENPTDLIKNPASCIELSYLVTYESYFYIERNLKIVDD